MKHTRERAIDSSVDLDEKNLSNLVEFYEEELRRVLQGENSKDVFTEYERGNLRDAGILRYINMTWTIAERAMKYLRI